MNREVRQYIKEFKQEAVSLALKSPFINRTAKELGIPLATLHSWIKQLKSKTINQEKTPTAASDVANLIEENRCLHKELAIAKEEKEILKKASAYFAQHLK